MPSFKRIESNSVIESIEAQMMAKIFSGELQPGQKLPTERELAEQFGVSRSSVHQAFLTLEHHGLISFVPRRGSLVNDYRNHPTPGSLEMLMRYGSFDLDHALFTDMMDTRLWLESECARRACTHIYPKTLQKMKGMLVQMEDPQKSLDELTDLIYQFHYKLSQASGNSLYAMLFRGFEVGIRSLVRQHYSLKMEDLSESVILRRQLLDAIEAKDAHSASALVCRIINQGVDVLKARYV